MLETTLKTGVTSVKLRSQLMIGGLSLLILTLPGNSSHLDVPAAYARTTQLSHKQLYQLAQLITVKIIANNESIGSGIIIKKQGDTYTLVTNAHVLRVAKPPYQIQTSDGKIHHAQEVKSANFRKDDLALLQFRASNSPYRVAQLGRSSYLGKGQDVFASGFPYQLNEGPVSPSPSGGFAFKTGKVVLVLKKALEGGYQVGYTNDIQKGMSGGPLLNRSGELVGINGMHAYPLWEATDYYEDGSEPTTDLQKIIIENSWAIPIERVLKSVPTLVSK